MKPPILIGLLALIAAVIAFVVTRGNSAGQPVISAPLCQNLPAFKPLDPKSISTLRVEDFSVGTGAQATSGKTLTMNYIGYLPSGKSFDTSCNGQPFVTPIGLSRVIAGWDQGIPGMRVGGKRRLYIPASLAYGEQGAGGGVIPPNSPLIFDVELVAVQ